MSTGMFRVTSIVVASVLANPTPGDLQIGSYGNGKQYTVSVSKDMLEKSPRWMEPDENPPISARRAIELATAMKDSLVKDSDSWKWKLRSASLEPIDGHWFWEISFEGKFDGFLEGRPPNLRLVVLMDGTVVKPLVKDDSTPKAKKH